MLDPITARTCWKFKPAFSCNIVSNEAVANLVKTIAKKHKRGVKISLKCFR